MTNLKFKKGCFPNNFTYPLTKDQIDSVEPCRIVSPKIGKHHGYRIPDFNINESMEDLVKVRQDLGRNIFPWWYVDKHYPFKEEWGKVSREVPGPLAMEGLSYSNPKGFADIVRMDMPMDLNRAIHRWVLREGMNVKEWTPEYVNFLESTIDVQKYSADLVQEGLHKMFEVKWYYGIARPENTPINGKILGRLLPHYKEGAPSHPEAGHGHSVASAAGAKGILDKFPNPTYLQEKTIIDSAYLFSIARGLARVHFGETVHIGLHMGGLGNYMREDIVYSIRI